MVKRPTYEELEQRIKELEKLRLQNEIVDNISAGVFLVRTSDGVIVYANPTFERMFGYEAGELIGKHVSVVNAPTTKRPEETAEEIKKEIMQSFNQRGFWSGEVHNIKKDGTLFWCHANVSEFDHHRFGKVGIAVHEDITQKIMNKQELNRARKELEKSHAELERQVQKRTAELSKTNEELRKEVNDRKAAEAALKESELRYRTLFENAVIGIGVTTRDGMVVDANKSMVQMTGYTPDDLKHISITEIYHNSEDRLRVMEQFKTKGFVRDFETKLIHKDGTLFDVSLSLNPVLLNGEDFLLTAAKDITELKRQEDALRESDDRFNAFFMSSPVGLVIFDDEFRYLRINDVLARQNNLSVEEHLGKSIYEIVDADLAHAIVLSNQPVLQTGKPFSWGVDGEVPGESGLRHWMATAFSLSWRGKKGVGNVVIDITELKRKEKEVRERTRELEILYSIDQFMSQKFNIEESLDGILEKIMEAFQGDFGVLYLLEENAGGLKLRSHKGMSDTFIQDFKIFNVEKSASGDALNIATPIIWQIDNYPHPDMGAILAAEGIKTGIVIPLVSKGSIYGTVNIGFKETRCFSEEEKRLTATIGAQISISLENVRLYESVKQSAEELEKKVKARTHDLEATKDTLTESLKRLEAAVKISESKAAELESFTYSVSHDLKAPLRGIDGYSRLLMEDHADLLDEEGLYFLKMVLQSVQQMNQLIEDLLEYSRLDRVEFSFKEIDLVEMLTGLMESNSLIPEESGVLTELSLGVKRVVAEPEGLMHALGNLLDNAFKFSRNAPEPMIAVKSYERPGEWIIEIKDNGIGFSMKYHDQVFKVFNRLEKSEEYPGTGVGLAIVKKVMERIEGRVWAESEKGKGATFYLAIPKKEGALNEQK